MPLSTATQCRTRVLLSGVTDVGAPDPPARLPGAPPHGYARGEGGQVRAVWVQLLLIFSVPSSAATAATYRPSGTRGRESATRACRSARPTGPGWRGDRVASDSLHEHLHGLGGESDDILLSAMVHAGITAIGEGGATRPPKRRDAAVVRATRSAR